MWKRLIFQIYKLQVFFTILFEITLIYLEPLKYVRIWNQIQVPSKAYSSRTEIWLCIGEMNEKFRFYRGIHEDFLLSTNYNSMHNTKTTFYVKTFGCQMNYADSEKIHRVLLQAGCLKVLDPSLADIIVINTCSVRQKGEDRVFGFVREVRKFAKTTGKNPVIAVTGCMIRKTGLAKRYLETTERDQVYTITLLGGEGNFWNWDDPLLLRSDDIDLVFRIEETGHLAKMLSVILDRDFGNDEKWEEYLKISQISSTAASANVIIQTGCDNYCTFCIVPYTRGREYSRPIAEIADEVRNVVANGATEITLLWQNVNSYGKLTRKKLWNEEALTWEKTGSVTPFRELLNELGTIDGLKRIRFTSSNPHDMTPDILNAHFEIPSMCPYLHFALQSGSDAVLWRMNRKHWYHDFKIQLDYLRSKDPLFSVSTDIIVGFPGETAQEFEETAQAMRECEFDFAYVARYSVRNGTVASKLEDDVSATEKARRWSILNDILRDSVRKRNLLMIGRTEEILISGSESDTLFVGRTRNFKEVHLPKSQDLQIWDTVLVKITDLDGWALRGELV